MYVVYGISHTIVYIISSVWYSSVVTYVRIWLAQGWEGQWLHLHAWLSKWGHKAPQSSNEGSQHWVWLPVQVRVQAHTQTLRLLSSHWWAAAASF